MKTRIIFLILVVVMGIIGYSDKSYGENKLFLKVDSQKNCISFQNRVGIIPAKINLSPDTEYSVKLEGNILLNNNGIEKPKKLNGVYVCYNTEKGDETCSFLSENKTLNFKTPKTKTEFESWIYSTGTTLYNTGSYELVFSKR